MLLAILSWRLQALQELGQFACAVIIHQFAALTQNVTEQYFGTTESKQSLTGLRHFELNGTAHVVRIKLQLQN